MIFSLSLTAFATEPLAPQISTLSNTNTIVTDVTDNSDYKIVTGSYVRIWENPNVEPEFDVYGNVYGERYESKIVDTDTDYVITEPDGQPLSGYCIPGGGAILINPTDGHTISVALSASFGKVAPFSIGVGYAYTAAGVGGILVDIPASNNYYKVKLRHNYIINRVEYKHYKYNELLDTFYINKPILDSIDAYCVQTN